jgi:hypothetical protein
VFVLRSWVATHLRRSIPAATHATSETRRTTVRYTARTAAPRSASRSGRPGAIPRWTSRQWTAHTGVPTPSIAMAWLSCSRELSSPSNSGNSGSGKKPSRRTSRRILRPMAITARVMPDIA